MTLNKYIEGGGHGCVARLVRESGLSRGTVEKAARGEHISVPHAKLLSRATGGVVSARRLAGMW